jgi:hypothetical protein
MVEQRPITEVLSLQLSERPASEDIADQLGRLIPLVNGASRVARVGSRPGNSGLSSLLSWDDDGHLSVD